MTEEIPTEEEAAVTEEAPVTEEREAAPQVIEIRAPPPFDEAALEPFIDIWMQKRGLTDRKQAAYKLGRVLWSMGYDPRKDIQNVTTYINNLSTVLSAIPDTPETERVKSSLLARGAVDTAGMLSTTHFGGRKDEMDEMKEIMRFGMRMNMTMRALDQAFRGGNMETESSSVKELRAKVERMEKRSEFEAQLAPLKQQLNTLTEQIKELSKKPKTPEESAALKEVRGSIEKINERFEKKEERDAFAAEMKGMRDDLKNYADKIGGGGAGKGEVGDVFDQAIKLMDKISEVTKKYGGSVGEGELDWKAAAITTVGEIGTEAIRAAREIMSGKEAEEEVAREVKKEKVSERIIDRKVLNYIREHAAAGATEINTNEVAKELGLHPDQVLDSYKRLRDKGLITGLGGKKSEGKGEPENWVEG